MDSTDVEEGATPHVVSGPNVALTAIGSSLTGGGITAIVLWEYGMVDVASVSEIVQAATVAGGIMVAMAVTSVYLAHYINRLWLDDEPRETLSAEDLEGEQ